MRPATTTTSIKAAGSPSNPKGLVLVTFNGLDLPAPLCRVGFSFAKSPTCVLTQGNSARELHGARNQRDEKPGPGLKETTRRSAPSVIW